jgi:hypothetical protein
MGYIKHGRNNHCSSPLDIETVANFSWALNGQIALVSTFSSRFPVKLWPRRLAKFWLGTLTPPGLIKLHVLLNSE